MKKLFTLLFTAVLVFSLTMPVFAQEAAGTTTPKAEKKAKKKAAKKEKKEAKKEVKEEKK